MVQDFSHQQYVCDISTNVKNIEIYITNAVCISSPSSLIGISLHKRGLDTDRKSYTSHESHLTQPMDPEKKSLNCIFPTKYVIPKSLSRLAIGQVSHNLFILVISYWPKIGDPFQNDLVQVMAILCDPAVHSNNSCNSWARWAPTSCKWINNPLQMAWNKRVTWGYFTLLIGVITPFIDGSRPTSGRLSRKMNTCIDFFLGRVYLRSTPHPVTVTTRIITFLVGDPYKPSFATATGRGDNPRYIFKVFFLIQLFH